MIARARDNAGRAKATNVEFRLGEIEHLPVMVASVDAVISNSVVIPSQDKIAVFREVSRVLLTVNYVHPKASITSPHSSLG